MNYYIILNIKYHISKMSFIKYKLDNDMFCCVLSLISVGFQIMCILLLHMFVFFYPTYFTFLQFESSVDTLHILYIFQTTLLGIMFLTTIAHVSFSDNDKKRTLILNLSILFNCFLFYFLCSTKSCYTIISNFHKEIIPTRYFQWVSTCTIMILILFKFSALDDAFIKKLLLYTALMLYSGLLSSICTGFLGSCMVCISFVFGYKTIKDLHYMMLCCENSSSDDTSKKVFSFLKYFVTISWCIFPIIWILIFNDIITSNTETILYMIADSFAKLMFCSSVQYCKSHTINIELETQIQKLKRINIEQNEEYEKSKTIFNDRLEQDQKKLIGFLLNSLGNPLSAIAMCVEEIKKKTNNNITNKLETFETLKISVKNTLKIVDDVLNIQKLDSGTFKIISAPFSIKHSVSSLVNQFRNINSDFDFNLDIDDTIPIVIGDNYRLNQVLSILIQNSIDYSCKVKQTKISVEEFNFADFSTDTNLKKTRIKFIVMDYGCGIHESDKPKIFSPFCHIESTQTKRTYKTGLSLSLAAKIVQRMHGSIGFDSNLNSGSTFTVEFPFQISETQTLSYNSDSNSEANSNKFIKTSDTNISTPNAEIRTLTLNNKNIKNILILDDDNIIIKLFQKNIATICLKNDIQSQIYFSKSCDDAITLCETVKFHLILIDNHLYGGKTGIDFLISHNKALIHNNTICIGITSNADSESVEKYKKYGAKQVFPKPISNKDLTKIILELK